MKNLFTILVLVITFTTTVFGQTEKSITKSINLAETHTAYVMLPGDVAVTEWDESFLRVTATIYVENMDETVVKRLVVVGRYSIEAKMDKFGKMMVIQMPNLSGFVAVQGVDLVERYTFEVNAPKGYKVVVKDNLNPNAIDNNASLRQTL